MDYWEKPEKNGICICEGNSPETVIFPRLLFNLCVSRKYMGNILLSTKTTYNNLPEERNAGVMALPCKIYTLQTHDFHELPQIPRFSFQDQEKKQNLRTRKGAVCIGRIPCVWFTFWHSFSKVSSRDAKEVFLSPIAHWLGLCRGKSTYKTSVTVVTASIASNWKATAIGRIPSATEMKEDRRLCNAPTSHCAW